MRPGLWITHSSHSGLAAHLRKYRQDESKSVLKKIPNASYVESSYQQDPSSTTTPCFGATCANAGTLVRCIPGAPYLVDLQFDASN